MSKAIVLSKLWLDQIELRTFEVVFLVKSFMVYPLVNVLDDNYFKQPNTIMHTTMT